MSVLHPSQKEELSKLMVQDYDKKQTGENNNQDKLIMELEGLEDGNHGGDKRRMTVNEKEFYDNRPKNTIFIETSNEQDERVRKNSPFGGLKTWKLIKLIVKSNDDVRQEQFAM
jgi:phosphatidylinositol kinase/protein kinase (PI-3  family)